MIYNCKNCRKKFTAKIFNYRYCEQTEECKEAGTEAKNDLIKKAMEKVKVSKEKKSRQETKVLREKLKTLSEYESEAKKSFQHFIRSRDKELACISCGEFEKELVDGGHYFKAELFSGLIFNEKNCHKQCRKCNRYLSGNEIAYRMGLVARYGLKYVEDLESISDSKRVYKYTKEELIAKKLQYDIKIKELK